MDSLTQIVLGASMGEMVAGRKIGNRAMVWGAAAATIPDLDVFATLATPVQVAKARTVSEGADAAYKAAIAAGVKMAFGTDLLGPWREAGTFENLSSEEFFWAAKYMSNFDVLRMATGLAGELHALSGENTPYKDGPTGIIKEGAYADILLVDGNPLEDIMVVADPENLKIIMKDGKIYKNTLQ